MPNLIIFASFLLLGVIVGNLQLTSLAMQKRIYLFISTLFLCSILLWGQTYKGDDILGYWMSPKKDLLIKVYKESNKYYGKVIWFFKYAKTDENPNGVPEEQWLNTVVMKHFVFEKNEWNHGEIHNLKTGKKYSAYIQLKNQNTLKLVGYIFLPIFSESVLFTKYN